MSLRYYEKKYANLNLNRSQGRSSPHKVAMLHAVHDLIASKALTENKILFGSQLLAAFTLRFNEIAFEGDRNNPYLPFFHLRSEGFWHHHLLPGRVSYWSDLTTAGSNNVITENVRHVSLDDELFELLQDEGVRRLLETVLYTNIELTFELKRQALAPRNGGWDWLECEACVEDYFAMLNQEMKGEKYNKTQHRNRLSTLLNKRSDASIEYKHRNITAILIELDMPYITGYKPMYNYQTQLREAVLAHLASNGFVVLEEHILDFNQPPVYHSNLEDAYDDKAPERAPKVSRPEREFLARIQNFSKREADNRSLGEAGETFVFQCETFRLEKLGRSDLAKEVEWSSKDRGDGLGYDIRSFTLGENTQKESELFIEVKTTNRGKYQAFYVSENELEFSRKFAENFALYRVYEMRKQARYFQLNGAIDKHVNLEPTTYRGSF